MSKRKDGLFRRGESRVWYCWVNGVRRSTGYTDAKAALARKAEIERLAADPSRRAAELADLKGAVADFFDQLRAVEDKKQGTINFYRIKCNSLLRYFGEARSLASLRPMSVWRQFIDDRLKSGASRNTIGHELTAARRVLQTAKGHDAFPYDLDAVFPQRYSREYKPRTRALSGEEIRKLLEAMDATSPRLAGFAAWEIATASRWSEVEKAEAVDVLEDGAMVRVRGTKTKASNGIIPIAPAFQGWLLWAVERGAKEGPLFGRWCNPSRDLDRACKRAGIPKCTTNDLRRTHASLLRDAGVEARAIAAVLRHSSPRMVEQVYAPTTGAHAASLVRKADVDLGAPGATAKFSSPVSQNSKSRCPGPESNWRHEDFQSADASEIAAFPLDSQRAERSGRTETDPATAKFSSGFRLHLRARPRQFFAILPPAFTVPRSAVAGQGRVGL